VIAAAHRFLFIGEAGSGEEAIRVVDVLSPQLVLTDVTMPRIGGIAAARQIVKRHPEVAVALMSVDDPSVHPELVTLGHVAFTRKTGRPTAEANAAVEDARAAESSEHHLPQVTCGKAESAPRGRGTRRRQDAKARGSR
jgi:DNA-binding NarL/FixJ family response regulator